MKSQEPVFNLHEVASQLEMSPEIIYQHIKSNRLRSHKVRGSLLINIDKKMAAYRCTQGQIDQLKAWLEYCRQHDPIHSVMEVASQLNVAPEIVYQHILAGRLHAYKFRGYSFTGMRKNVGAYRCSQTQIDELVAFIDANKQGRTYLRASQTALNEQKEQEQEQRNLTTADKLTEMLNHEQFKKPKHDGLSVKRSGSGRFKRPTAEADG